MLGLDMATERSLTILPMVLVPTMLASGHVAAMHVSPAGLTHLDTTP
jgi:hypothetical protein